MVNLDALPGSLDLFELMVNYVAGGIFMSILIWAVIILITAIMGRLSMPTILVILISYFVTAMVGYFGALAIIPVTTFALSYMIIGILNYWNELK